ncbi:hypothetical protein PYW08_000904 [Mythimna loreyi]|uniref:Uncharacterized protein n=1 Tax=Mythimna loreyi TaxID=667449 RepID=A0ACC2R354_9NEOP|nr:hypothetical protein PYW08_000904 [Mythimna loreyi]
MPLTCCNFSENRININLYPRLKLCIEYIITIICWGLQTRVYTMIFLILGYKACKLFFWKYCTYGYPHLPAEILETFLYKQRSSKLVLHQSKPYCIYDEILNNTDYLSIKEVTRNVHDFSANGLVNGSYAPEHCNALFSVAIIVPFKNRHRQLDVFLPYIHNFLRKQNIHYRLYVIEQQDEKMFNKGILYNVGAKTAMLHKFPCVVLHDLDLLPVDAGNLYVCTNEPRHMSASIDKFRFMLPYEELIGGVTALKTEQYVAMNGYSNRFQGWGGEDDDFQRRLAPQGLKLVRFPIERSRYIMLGHPQERHNTNRYKVMEENIKYGFVTDGLSTLPHVSVRISNHPLFTLVRVQL